MISRQNTPLPTANSPAFAEAPAGRQQPTALIELHFFPSIEYFCALFPHDQILLEKHEFFVKQTYRNRCYLLGANRVERLTLPLAERHGKMSVDRVLLDEGERWRHNIWRTITSAYAKAPYFEHFAGDVNQVVFSKRKFLYDLNLEVLSICVRWLRWSKPVHETTGYEMPAARGITDLRNVILAKTDYARRGFYREQPYHQVFGSSFVPNLSIMDLVFSEGPGAGALVERSARRT